MQDKTLEFPTRGTKTTCAYVVDEEVSAYVDTMSEAHNTSKSAIVNTILKDYMQRHPLVAVRKEGGV